MNIKQISRYTFLSWSMTMIASMVMGIVVSGCNNSATPTEVKVVETPVPVVTSTLAVAPSSGPQKVTILADDGYKPFTYGDNGVAKGMYVDVLKTIFSRMEGYEVTLEPVPWQRAKQMAERGEAFGLEAPFFHGHDWPYLYPYSLPYYVETVVAICTEDAMAKPRPNWPEDYIGLKVGNIVGYDGYGGDKFYELVKQGKISYEEVNGSSENILRLGLKRVDCIMMEERVFGYEFGKLKEKGEYDEGGKHAKVTKAAVIGTDPVYIGYSRTARQMGKYPFQDDFMQKFDSILYKMQKSGEISQIMDAYHE